MLLTVFAQSWKVLELCFAVIQLALENPIKIVIAVESLWIL